LLLFSKFQAASTSKSGETSVSTFDSNSQLESLLLEYGYKITIE